MHALAGERETIAALDRVAAATQRRLAGKDLGPGGVRFTTNFGTMSTVAWESTVATQAMSYMAFHTAQALSQSYAQSRAYNLVQEEARKPFFEPTAAVALRTSTASSFATVDE